MVKKKMALMGNFTKKHNHLLVGIESANFSSGERQSAGTSTHFGRQ